jgi:formylglycine-generating enzyme required for sulfatase activity
MRAPRRHLLLAWLLLPGLVVAAPTTSASAQGTRAKIPGGSFASILPPAPKVKQAKVAAFEMDRRPVSNDDFARFVAANPRWRRDRVARVFADTGYLRHWSSPASPGKDVASQPITQVSWFAAKAYCESQGARLPTWHEWEYVSAAGARVPDARQDPAWRQAILDWYARPATAGLPAAGAGAPNYYGVRDVHGVVWEWVLDLGSMMVSGDNREQGDPDLMRFCGSGALTLEQKDNYAMLMRIATLSSMQASYTSSSMGFRCVTGPEAAP